LVIILSFIFYVYFTCAKHNQTVVLEEYSFDGISRADILFKDCELQVLYDIEKIREYPIYKIRPKNLYLFRLCDKIKLKNDIENITKKYSSGQSIFSIRDSEISDFWGR